MARTVAFFRRANDLALHRMATPRISTFFKISIRDAGITNLNRALALAGAEVGFKARLVLDGAITERDVDRAQNELRAGSRPLTELLSMHA